MHVLATAPAVAKPLLRERYAEIRALAGADAAELLIYGDIGEDWWDPEASITAKKVVEQLAGLDVSALTVRINSFGGQVADALAIYNAIKRHRANATVEIDGVAMSAASLIAMAGDTVRMAENAVLMIHAPWTVAAGNSQMMREAADTLDTYAKAMSTSYARNGITAADALTLLTDGQDHYYTAAEAQAAGFVDAVSEAVAVAAVAKHCIAAAQRYRMPHDIDIAAQIAAVLVSGEPLPTSAPSAGANPGAQPMPIQAPPAAAPTAQPQPDPVAANVVDIEAAAERRAQELVTAHHGALDAAFGPLMAAAYPHAELVRAEVGIARGDLKATPDVVRARILAKLGEQTQQPIAGGSYTRVGLVEDERAKARTGMVAAILMRVGAQAHDQGNQFRGLRLSEMARACLRAVNVPQVDSLTAEELAPLALSFGPVRGSQGTSDFPVILENTMHKLVLMGYAAVPITYDRFCKIGDVSDFRAWQRIVPGLIGNLDGVNEHGEYRNKAIPDGQKNSVQASRKGNILSITPEVLVNDDTGTIGDMARGIGAAGPRTIERSVYALIEANPTLTDGYALFATEHGNLVAAGGTTGGVPSVALFDAARVAMAKQTAPGADAEYLDIRPAIALANTGLEGAIKVLNDAQYDPDTANKLQRPNMVAKMVREVVSSPRLSAAPWYLFADPLVAPVLEVVFLNGQREPRLVQQEAFRTGGLEWRVELPFGVGAIDFRGAFKNPGA
jgi:ATP-dependent protease ClpP protease subunit